MRIDPKLAGATPLSVGVGRSAGGTFKVETAAADAAAVRSARGGVPLATLDAILALQGEDSGEGRERRRRAARRGQDLLEALDGLKVALLSGEVTPAALHRISDRMAQDAIPSGDPKLDAVVAEIELRAQVEIAKLTRR